MVFKYINLNQNLKLALAKYHKYIYIVILIFYKGGDLMSSVTDFMQLKLSSILSEQPLVKSS